MPTAKPSKSLSQMTRRGYVHVPRVPQDEAEHTAHDGQAEIMEALQQAMHAEDEPSAILVDVDGDEEEEEDLGGERRLRNKAK